MESTFADLKTLTAAITDRHSVRTYDGRDLNGSQKLRLNNIIARLSAGRRHKWTISLVSGDGGTFRPSTYGVIKGARTYALLTYDTTDETSAFAAGYAMERVVLEAVSMGLGTCWIGGTFKEKTFMDAVNVPDGQTLAAVVSIGYDSERTRLLERLTKAVAKSATRRPFNDLFVASSPSGLIPLPSDSIWRNPLEAVRVAPSAVNAQPWRAVCDGERVHFFYRRSRSRSALDMGIALCHFDIARQAAETEGRWSREQPDIEPPEGTVYAVTFTRSAK